MNKGGRKGSTLGQCGREEESRREQGGRGRAGAEIGAHTQKSLKSASRRASRLARRLRGRRLARGRCWRPGSAPPFAAGLGSPVRQPPAPCPPAACSPPPPRRGCRGSEGCRPALERGGSTAQWGTQHGRMISTVQAGGCRQQQAALEPRIPPFQRSRTSHIPDIPTPSVHPSALHHAAYLEAWRQRSQQLDAYAQPDQRRHAAVLHRRSEQHLQRSARARGRSGGGGQRVHGVWAWVAPSRASRRTGHGMGIGVEDERSQWRSRSALTS